MRIAIAKASIGAAIIALGFGVYPFLAPAGEPGGASDMLQRACTVAAGHFEQGWIYSDTGVQWGEIASCVTGNIRLSCRGDICRATSLDRTGRTAVLVKQKASADRGVTVRSERDEFDRVLTSMAMY